MSEEHEPEVTSCKDCIFFVSGKIIGMYCCSLDRKIGILTLTTNALERNDFIPDDCPKEKLTKGFKGYI